MPTINHPGGPSDSFIHLDEFPFHTRDSTFLRLYSTPRTDKRVEWVVWPIATTGQTTVLLTNSWDETVP